MAAEISDPAARFSIPEGYAVEPLEDGRLAVYHASTSTWLGYFSPVLCDAQEMVNNLISLHEEEPSREVMPDPVMDSPVPERAAGDRAEPASRMPEREKPGQDSMTPAVDPTDTARADALRIRELEMGADLAVEALRQAGDEATAEIVRSVLRNGSE